MATTGLPSRVPTMRSPLCEATVERAKCGIFSYGTTAFFSMADATLPRPVPRMIANSGVSGDAMAATASSMRCRSGMGLVAARGLEPALAVDGGRAALPGGGDGLPVDVVDAVARRE